MHTQSNGRAGAKQDSDAAPRGYDEIKELAEALRLPLERLLALAAKNDPFYAGAPAQLAKAEWFAGLWDRFHFPPGIHVRRIHYHLISQSPALILPDGSAYQNTQRCWSELGDASKCARHLDLVDVAAFTDRRNPEPHIAPGRPDAYDGEPGCEVGELLDWALPSIPTRFATTFDLPEVSVKGYDFCDLDQPYHLEIWIEKSTMNDVLVPLCRQLGITLVPGLGFQSITSVIRMLERIRQLPTNKPTRIFHISDYDPAGDQMPVAVARQVEFYRGRFAPDADIKLTPLALTRAQVVKYDLPRIPIKDSDRRKGDYQDRRGEGAVELDAMEALHQGELGRLVRKAVAPYRDEELEERLTEARDEAEQQVESDWEEQTGQHREELERLTQRVEEITACYEDELTHLHNMLEADLAPVRGRMNEIRHTVTEIVTAFQDDPPELPERPEPGTNELDEQTWLYASEREYLEQMDCYREYKGGKHVKDLDKTCPACGKKFTPRGRQLYCSGSCRTRACRAKQGGGGA
jgi:hypothetical protein